MKHFIYTKLTLFALLCAPLAAADKPNVIVFLVDDMGWVDSSTYGSKFYETPNMNRLAKDGMMFTQAYAEPLCSPTRAAFITGKYPARFAMHQAITGQSKAKPTVPTKPRRGEQVCWPESMSHLPTKLGSMTSSDSLPKSIKICFIRIQ